MDSNHRFLGVSQTLLPLDHGTMIMLLKAEAVRLELTSEMYSPPVFETGSSTSRMTSVRSDLFLMYHNNSPQDRQSSDPAVDLSEVVTNQ